MKRLLTLILLIVLSAINAFAEWEATGVSTNIIEKIHDIESHKGVLFASADSVGFIKSTDKGESWHEVGQTEFITYPKYQRVNFIINAGNLLYVVTHNRIFNSSMVYKSSDGGQSFVPDTIGLPSMRVNNDNIEIRNIYNFHYSNGYLIINFGYSYYWKKQGSDVAWIENNEYFIGGLDFFVFYDDNFYVMNSTGLFKSEDYGQTWTEGANTNIPIGFRVNLVNVNSSTGRIYVAGEIFFATGYRLLYTDDEGESWDSIAIKQYIKKNWRGHHQSIISMYSNGDLILIGLDNDADSSAPDMLISTDGGKTFTDDSKGLPENVIPETNGSKFLEFDGYLFLALSFMDIFRKKLDISDVVELNPLTTNVEIYPNPSEGTITVKSESEIKKIYLYNLEGELIYETDFPVSLNS